MHPIEYTLNLADALQGDIDLALDAMESKKFETAMIFIQRINERLSTVPWKLEELADATY